MQPYIYKEKIPAFTDRNAKEITYATFTRHCEWKPLAQELGYAVGPGQKGLPLRHDWLVKYFRSKRHGEVCFYFSHGSHFYVFFINNT